MGDEREDLVFLVRGWSSRLLTEGYCVEADSWLKSFQETSMSAPLRGEQPKSQRRRSHQGRYGSCDEMAEQMIESEEQEWDCSDQSQSKGRKDAWTRKVCEEAESD